MIGYYSCGLTGYEILDIRHGLDDYIQWLYVGSQRERHHTDRGLQYAPTVERMEKCEIQL